MGWNNLHFLEFAEPNYCHGTINEAFAEELERLCHVSPVANIAKLHRFMSNLDANKKDG